MKINNHFVFLYICIFFIQPVFCCLQTGNSVAYSDTMISISIDIKPLNRMDTPKHIKKKRFVNKRASL